MKLRVMPVVVMLALAACGGETPIEQPAETTLVAEPSTAAPTTAKETDVTKESPALAIEAEGLRLFNKQSGSARPIAFGTLREDTLAMLAFKGEPQTGTNGECGAGPLDFANWPDGLGLFFQDGKFVGWNLNERDTSGLSTASGIGIGSSRADLEAAYAAEISETTLGTEFAAGELFGLLDGKTKTAKITNMWGGVSCNFR